jgi:hypothetical protein
MPLLLLNLASLYDQGIKCPHISSVAASRLFQEHAMSPQVFIAFAESIEKATGKYGNEWKSMYFSGYNEDASCGLAWAMPE